MRLIEWMRTIELLKVAVLATMCGSKQNRYDHCAATQAEFASKTVS